MTENTRELEKLGNFLHDLVWQDYDYAPCPDMPAGLPAKALPTVESEEVLEEYRLLRIKWRESIERIQPGTVLFLKGGKFILVGHVNENLTSHEHFEPDFDFADILKIAHLW